VTEQLPSFKPVLWLLAHCCTFSR